MERDNLSSVRGEHAEPYKAASPIELAPVLEDIPIPEGSTLFQVAELYGVDEDVALGICKTRGYKPAQEDNPSRLKGLPDGLTMSEIIRITGMNRVYIAQKARKIGLKIAPEPRVPTELDDIVASIPRGLTSKQVMEYTGWTKEQVHQRCYGRYKFKPMVRKYDWSVVNFNYSNGQLAAMLDTPRRYVGVARKKYAPETLAEFGNPERSRSSRRHWRKVDFNYPTKVLAARLETNVHVIIRARKKYAPETVGKFNGAQRGRKWDRVDFNYPNREIAARMKVPAWKVFQARQKYAPETVGRFGKYPAKPT